MKRLAKYGWTDVAIRTEKQLLILVCESPEHAKQLFLLLRFKDHYFSYKYGTDFFDVNITVQSYGDYTVSMRASHPSFRQIIDFNKHTFNFTTGALLPGNQLGYLKETLPLKVPYFFPHIRPAVTASKALLFPNADDPDFLIDGISKIQQAFRSILPWRNSRP